MTAAEALRQWMREQGFSQRVLTDRCSVMMGKKVWRSRIGHLLSGGRISEELRGALYKVTGLPEFAPGVAVVYTEQELRAGLVKGRRPRPAKRKPAPVRDLASAKATFLQATSDLLDALFQTAGRQSVDHGELVELPKIRELQQLTRQLIATINPILEQPEGSEIRESLRKGAHRDIEHLLVTLLEFFHKFPSEMEQYIPIAEMRKFLKGGA